MQTLRGLHKGLQHPGIAVFAVRGRNGAEDNAPWVLKSNCTTKTGRTKALTTFNHQYSMYKTGTKNQVRRFKVTYDIL